MNESAANMDDETLAFLAEVEKGKPRRFVMLTKGASILSLIVYKKGGLEKRKKEVKQAGTGQVCFGVVDGSGPNIRFNLCVADGFQAEPVKATILKSFLSEGGFACKPAFVIVNELPAVLDEDGNLGVGVEEGQNQQATDVPPPLSNDSQLEKLRKILNKLVAAANRALQRSPSRKSELLLELSSAKVLLDQEKLAEAETKLLVVGKLVKDILAADPDPRSNESSSELAEWRQLRLQVIQELKKLAKVIASTKASQAAAAVTELKAVIGVLVENPIGNDVVELQRFLREDHVVSDVCEMAFDFRTPMLDVLSKL